MSNFWQTLTERFSGVPKVGRSTTTERNEEELRRMHEAWMLKHEQTYPNAEEKERRFVLFKESVEDYDRYSAQHEGCTFVPRWLADRTKEEIEAIMPPLVSTLPEGWEERMRDTRRDVSKLPNCGFGFGCAAGVTSMSSTNL